MSLQDLEQRLQQTIPSARIEVQPLPGCPEIRLGLINADFSVAPLPPDVMHDVIARPAYWAFCWGSGLALGRLLLDTPAWVAGRTVVDLGSGSGVVAIAAALAGAARVIACDTDANARAASSCNAALNGVDVEIAERLPARCDLLLMADVLYDRDNLPLLSAVQGHAAAALVADSRVRDLPQPGYAELATVPAMTFPNLGGFDEFTSARIFYWAGPGGTAAPTTPDG